MRSQRRPRGEAGERAKRARQSLYERRAPAAGTADDQPSSSGKSRLQPESGHSAPPNADASATGSSSSPRKGPLASSSNSFPSGAPTFIASHDPASPTASFKASASTTAPSASIPPGPPPTVSSSLPGIQLCQAKTTNPEGGDDDAGSSPTFRQNLATSGTKSTPDGSSVFQDRLPPSTPSGPTSSTSTASAPSLAGPPLPAATNPLNVGTKPATWSLEELREAQATQSLPLDADALLELQEILLNQYQVRSLPIHEAVDSICRSLIFTWRLQIFTRSGANVRSSQPTCSTLHHP
jgi:hypothetical protein